MRRSREHALLLLRKAGQDEYVVVKLLPDAGTPDEVLGFHLQQGSLDRKGGLALLQELRRWVETLLAASG